MKRTHKGLIYGFIPVYLDMTDEECPIIEGRNWLCEIVHDIYTPIFGFAIFVRTAIDPEYEPSFPILITGEL